MAWAMLGRMFVAPFGEGLQLSAIAEARHAVLLVPVVLLHAGQLLREWYGLRPSRTVRAVTAAVFLFLLLVIQRDAQTEFIYFQF